MFKFADQVIIRDGSRLDGKRGVVFRVNLGEIQVLLDREVFWVVTADQLERWSEDNGFAAAPETGDHCQALSPDQSSRKA